MEKSVTSNWVLTVYSIHFARQTNKDYLSMSGTTLTITNSFSIESNDGKWLCIKSEDGLYTFQSVSQPTLFLQRMSNGHGLEVVTSANVTRKLVIGVENSVKSGSTMVAGGACYISTDNTTNTRVATGVANNSTTLGWSWFSGSGQNAGYNYPNNGSGSYSSLVIFTEVATLPEDGKVYTIYFNYNGASRRYITCNAGNTSLTNLTQTENEAMTLANQWQCIKTSENHYYFRSLLKPTLYMQRNGANNANLYPGITTAPVKYPLYIGIETQMSNGTMPAGGACFISNYESSQGRVVVDNNNGFNKYSGTGNYGYSGGNGYSSCVRFVETSPLVLMNMIKGVGYPATTDVLFTTMNSAAAAYCELGGNTSDNAKAFVDALVAYKNSTTVSMPELGKLYHIKSGYTNQKFFNQAMAMYNNANSLGWTNFNADNSAFYFSFIPCENGEYDIQHANSNMYVDNTDNGTNVLGFISAKPATHIAITSIGQGQFILKSSSADHMHANNHNSGGNSNGTVIGWQDNNASQNVPGFLNSWYIEEATQVPVLTNAYGWTSIYYNYKLQLPEGVNAYVAKKKDGVDDTAELLEIPTNAAGNIVLPAGTPVMLKGDANHTYMLSIIADATVSESSIPENNLVGCYRADQATGLDSRYVFGASRSQIFKSTAALKDNSVYYVPTSSEADILNIQSPLVTTREYVDITIDIWRAKGSGYTNADCTEGCVPGASMGMKAWKLDVTDAEADIKGLEVPRNLEFKIVSKNHETGIGGVIASSSNAQYYYKKDSSNPFGLSFRGTRTGNEFEMSVADGYFILQYEIGFIQGSASYNLIFTNPNGGIVETANPTNNAKSYNLTDSPASKQTSFTATTSAGNSPTPDTGECCANFFQVRIVDKTYILNFHNVAYQAVKDALSGTVGFPLGEEEVEGHEGNLRSDLETAKGNYETAAAAYEANQTDETEAELISKYCAMAQAYSKFISCRHIQLPESSKLYNVSILDTDGNKHLISMEENGMTLVPYTDDNKKQDKTRWITHISEATGGKFVFVNKANGHYGQANSQDYGTGTVKLYDPEDCAFEVGVMHQDINDYMESATDEKLLGAVTLKSMKGPKDRAELDETTGAASPAGPWYMTYNFTANKWATIANSQAPRYMGNLSSAVVMEEAEDNTYGNATFKAPVKSDGKKYASFYTFYPTAKPAGSTAYYCTMSETEGYLKLNAIDGDVIPAKTAVILIKDAANAEDTEAETVYMYMGFKTSPISVEGNVLKGSIYPVADYTADYTYVLNGGQAAGIGFYKFNGSAIPACKAYYVAEAGTEVRGFLFTDKDGVETKVELNAAEAADAVVYDLSGRRVQNATHGLFIVNGKKVVK